MRIEDNSQILEIPSESNPIEENTIFYLHHSIYEQHTNYYSVYKSCSSSDVGALWVPMFTFPYNQWLGAFPSLQEAKDFVKMKSVWELFEELKRHGEVHD